jgi:NTP pyrophosphatase (non-canonical NTP hydrolase)
MRVVVPVPDNPRSWVSEHAARIGEQLRINGFDDVDGQVFCLAEEVGEFVKAYRRWSGRARRNGTAEERNAELADVVLAAYVTAEMLGIDLDVAVSSKLTEIYSRGWREVRCEDWPACSLPAGHEPPCSLSLDNVGAVDAENARRLAAEVGHGRTQP